MDPLNRSHTIWLARGVALGAFLLELLRVLRAGLNHRREISFGRRRLPGWP